MDTSSTRTKRKRSTPTSQVVLQVIFILITTAMWAVTAYLLTFWPVMLGLTIASCAGLLLQPFEFSIPCKRRTEEVVRDIASGKLDADKAMEEL